MLQATESVPPSADELEQIDIGGEYLRTIFVAPRNGVQGRGRDVERRKRTFDKSQGYGLKYPERLQPRSQFAQFRRRYMGSRVMESEPAQSRTLRDEVGDEGILPQSRPFIPRFPEREDLQVGAARNDILQLREVGKGSQFRDLANPPGSHRNALPCRRRFSLCSA